MFHAIADVIEKYLGIPRDDVGGVMAIIGVIVLLYLWRRESKNNSSLSAIKLRSNGFSKCLNVRKTWWPGTESNRRHKPFQGSALPTELPGLIKT